MRVDLIDCYVAENSRGWTTPVAAAGREEEPVFEDRWYVLAVSDRAGGKPLGLKIGDEVQRLGTRIFNGVVEFERGVYFESASGPTEIAVGELLEDGKVQTIFQTTVYVVPSKIGWGNYKRMVQDLQRVCQALITDIRGKSSKTGTGEADETAQPWLTHEEELEAIGRIVRRLRPVLREIKLSPKTTMEMVYGYGRANRCRSQRGIATLVKHGIDPWRDVNDRGCKVGRLSESRNLAEHRLIKAFLKLLRERVQNCRISILADVRRLEAEKKYRSRTSRAGEPSLYESEDLPRIRRYRLREAETAEIVQWLEAELGDEFWTGIGEEMFAPENSQFAENEYYLEVAKLIFRYLRNTSHWGGTFASGLMMKKTSRLYEQWVLVQLVAAFEQAGVRMTRWDEIISRNLNRQFGVDLSRNTTFTAPLTGNFELTVRYEPWIYGREERRNHPDETLCHSGRGEAEWSPDIVVELVKLTGAGRHTVYAVVLDAKYSGRPSKEMRENVRKYALIRTNEGRYGRRVARQVWLVYPGGENSKRRFWLEDEVMFFSGATGVTYRDTSDTVEAAEQVFGEIVAPPGGKLDTAEELSDIGVKPKQVFLDFATGTLAYFRSLTL